MKKERAAPFWMLTLIEQLTRLARTDPSQAWGHLRMH